MGTTGHVGTRWTSIHVPRTGHTGRQVQGPLEWSYTQEVEWE